MSKLWKQLGERIAILVLPLVLEHLVVLLEKTFNADLNGDGKVGA